jgi:hypothetical protein
MTALDDLTALLAPLPGASSITDSMKQTALTGSQIPDSLGVWPGQAGYQTTYDIYFAATNLLGFLQAQPVVRQSSSEGTSVAVDAPDWSGVGAYYRSMSPILQATSTGPLTKVLIPDGPHVARVDMSGRWNDVNVDTDLG